MERGDRMYSPYTLMMPLQQNLQPQTSSAIQYVNGRQSADNFQMMPNTSVILMDSTQDRFYIKKADASGSCITKTYSFQEVTEDEQSPYVTRKELESFKEEIKSLIDKGEEDE